MKPLIDDTPTCTHPTMGADGRCVTCGKLLEQVDVEVAVRGLDGELYDPHDLVKLAVANTENGRALIRLQGACGCGASIAAILDTREGLLVKRFLCHACGQPLIELAEPEPYDPVGSDQ